MPSNHCSFHLAWLWYLSMIAISLVNSVSAQENSWHLTESAPISTSPTPKSPLQDKDSAPERNESNSTDEASQPPDQNSVAKDPLLFTSGRLKVKASLAGVVQASGVVGSWWNLSETFAPSENYKPDRAWGEAWIKPGITTDIELEENASLYSGLSFVGSGNVGKDVFEQGNRGLYAIEDGYIGARLGDRESASAIDISYGSQQYKIGSGMLIAVGAYNGFERGAATTFARRAWEEAGLIKWSKGKLTIDGFYLNPNELPSSDTNTRLGGAKSEIALGENQYLGVAYLNVLSSELPYLGAPLQLIPNGRDGLNTVHTYMQWNPLAEAAPRFYFAGDYAHQWNDRISMSSNAFSGELGNQFIDRPFAPKTSYSFRSFQGDDPNTTDFEKFDPLFYEGSPAQWASGSNGSFSFLNSNVQAHRLFFNLNASERDILSFYYWHLLADQINSPLQFGQAGRIAVVGGEPQIVSGVPDSHLSDDFYVEHFRIVSRNIFLTTGFAVSIPGSGLRALVTDSTTWYGGLVNLAFQY
jgi:hypothetical protein